jgi:hypothetical protein
MFVRTELVSGCGNIGDHYHAAKTVDEAIQTGRWRSASKSCVQIFSTNEQAGKAGP